MMKFEEYYTQKPTADSALHENQRPYDVSRAYGSIFNDLPSTMFHLYFGRIGRFLIETSHQL